MTSAEQVKPKPLYEMFNAVPRHYDVVNKVITWGMDKKWRVLAARECVAGNPQTVLDLCCGTGDLAIAIAGHSGSKTSITGFDYAPFMLDIAREKAAALPLKNVSFISGEASALPFPEGYFDCLGISFAFRNLTYKNPLAKKHISEMCRVIKKGGKCVIVESSQPKNGFIRWLDHVYLRVYVRNIATLISGNPGAYRYLSESAARFYTPTEVRGLLLSAGFSKVTYRPLFFGASGIHVATK